MTTAQDVVNYSKNLVGKKVTVPTNPYGGQCVAFNDHIVQHFTNGKKNLAYTNAKDTLAKAAQQGLIVVYNDHPDKYPQPGDSIVYDWGTDPYGHIGIVIEADPNVLHTLEQNVDGYRDENGNGQNDQLEIGGGGYVREMHRNVSDYQYVTGWFRLKYDEPKPKEEKKEEENDMFTISAPGRGIGLVQGGTFFPILDAKDPIAFWEAGVKNIAVSTATFDSFQGKAQKSSLDDATVKKLIDGINK
ncbi:CHAP domain-containing protein [Collinsella sp. Sow4_D11]|uniref:CHAP domain-containing protein n=1 Tax=Collinsella sp. Sow4_D11 TaxID=3438775 RepID=UPI003F9259A3